MESQPVVFVPAEKRKAGVTPPAPPRRVSADIRGCPACRHTGYKGRVAFHELVLITEEIRTMISEGRSVQEISRAAAKVGYKPLRYDGLKKVLLGLTTIDEIDQNTSFEWAT